MRDAPHRSRIWRPLPFRPPQPRRGSRGDPAFDNTIPLLFTEGYAFITRHCQSLDTDIFATRIMLRKAYSTYGQEAAEQFYFRGRFTRRGALPLFALTLIQDVGSVMVLNDTEHHRRKAMFPGDDVVRIAATDRPAHRGPLAQSRRKVLIQERPRRPLPRVPSPPHRRHLRVGRPHARAVGDPLPRLRIRSHGGRRRLHRTSQLERTPAPLRHRGLGSPDHSQNSSRRTLRSARKPRWPHCRIPRQQRALPRCQIGWGGIAQRAAPLGRHRPLPRVYRHGAPGVPQLARAPAVKPRCPRGRKDLGNFVDEVRRYYPFIPVIGGRVIREFKWRDHHFERGEWLLFDIYGTNHDQRIWGDPDNFRPDRFREKHHGPYDLVSHGAGDRSVTHRCPGEAITVEQMKAITPCLVREMDYDVPPQDLTVSLAHPRSAALALRYQQFALAQLNRIWRGFAILAPPRTAFRSILSLYSSWRGAGPPS